MKVLHLTIKKKWFDMISSGEKKEEYREIKSYYISRLVDGLQSPNSWEVNEGFSFEWPNKSGLLHTMESAQNYDIVEFRNGYSKKNPVIRLKVKGIVQGYGKQKWGAEYLKPYFVIKLGEIIP